MSVIVGVVAFAIILAVVAFAVLAAIAAIVEILPPPGNRDIDDRGAGMPATVAVRSHHRPTRFSH